MHCFAEGAVKESKTEMETKSHRIMSWNGIPIVIVAFFDWEKLSEEYKEYDKYTRQTVGWCGLI